jgi:RNAse (barnase) inhibitor barstar
MPSKPKPAIDWRHLPSHYARYRRLNKIFWALRFQPKQEDRRNLTVTLDGAWITDLPSFWLSLGEAINGRHGYFGSNLAALDDCLCGGFGALPPLTIHLTHYNKVREALDCRAWIRYHAETGRDHLECDCTAEDLDLLGFLGYFGNGSETEIARWRSIYTAALNGQPFECNGYQAFFDVVLEVFIDRGVVFLPADGT